MKKFLSAVFSLHYELTRVTSKLFANSIVSLLLLTAFGQANAAPFETRGFRQCMTLEQAQRVAEERNQMLENFRAGSFMGNYNVLENGVSVGIISFEKNRLFSVSWSFGGGIESMVKQLEQLTKEGLKKTDVSWDSQLAKLGGKEEIIYSLEIDLASPTKDFFVKVTSSESTDLNINGGHISWNARCK